MLWHKDTIIPESSLAFRIAVAMAVAREARRKSSILSSIVLAGGTLNEPSGDAASLDNNAASSLVPPTDSEMKDANPVGQGNVALSEFENEAEEKRKESMQGVDSLLIIS